MKKRKVATRISTLPEDCLSEILSRTTPRDVCRLSATSSAFNDAAQSDSVWSAFLPSDVDDVVASAQDDISALQFHNIICSRKQLFFRLSSSRLLLENSLSFSLDKETGKKCYMIPSTMLFDKYGDIPKKWKWSANSVLKFSAGNRISLIQGMIKASLLSTDTSYSAHLVFKLSETPTDYYPVSVAANYVKAGNFNTTIIGNRACLTAETQIYVTMPSFWSFPQLREDGWMEVRMGLFYNYGGDDEVELVVESHKALVSALYVQGIELRPYNPIDMSPS